MNALWSEIRNAWLALGTAPRAALIAWLVATISLPVVRWVWGDREIRRGVSVGVVLQAATVFTTLWNVWGRRQAALVGLAIVGMGWAVEYIGSTTGFPFGRYHYTDRLKPQLGHVPLVIPLAWLMMMPPAWAVAGQIAPGRSILFIICSALAFTAWDLYLDPQMVGWRLWVWERPSGYFGIPWVNFAGWALAAAIMTAIIRPEPSAIAPLWLVYGLTWLLESVGLGIIWRQPGPATCGFLGMGSMLLWAWLAAH
jgi:putative membrane protein